MPATQYFAHKTVLWSLALLTAALDVGAFAGDLPTDWVSPRISGMGGSATANTGDVDDIFFNPAGVAWLRNPRRKNAIERIGFPGLTIGGNALGRDAFWEALNAPFEAKYWPYTELINLPTNFLEANRFGKIIEAAVENPGEPVFAEMQIYPSMLGGGRNGSTYVFGIPMRTEFNTGVLDANDTSKVFINSRTTVGGLLAFASGTKSRQLTYGINLRPNYRYAYETNDYPSGSTSFSAFKDRVAGGANKTWGVQADAGIMLVAADQWFPTLGIAVRNIPTKCVANYTNPVSGEKTTVCGSARTGTITAINATDSIDPTELRMGFSMTPRFRFGKARANLRLSVDGYPIPVTFGGNNYGFSDLSINEVLHAGAEFSIGNMFEAQAFGVRVGVSGANLTWGGSINLFGMEITYAKYPGYSLVPGQTERQDARHLIGLTSRW